MPDTSELLPGLTKKPPLPKKSEHLNCFQTTDSDICRQTDEITDFLSLKYTLTKNKDINYLIKSHEMSQGVEGNMESDQRKGNNMVSPIEEKNYLQNNSSNGCNFSNVNTFKDSNFMDNNIESFVSKDPDSFKNPEGIVYENDIIFQNWVEDVIQKESQTDKYLDELKKDHVLTNYNLTDNSKIVSSLSWTDEDKLPNISDIDLDRLFTEGNESLSRSEKNRNLSKDNPKSETVGKNKKNQKQSTSTINTAKEKKQNKSYQNTKGFIRATLDTDIDSWMTESAVKQTSSRNTSSAKSTYIDILKNLEEIEKQTAVEASDADEYPTQHDTYGKCSRSESMDDIVSILEVLENENKKSRKYDYAS